MDSNQNVIPLKLQIEAPGELDPQELEQLTLQLRTTLKELGVGSVELEQSAPGPEGSKALGAVTMGSLLIEVLPVVLPKLIDVTYDWLSKRQELGLKVKTEVAGQQVSLKADTPYPERLNLINRLKPTSPATQESGRKYALIIGNTSYKDKRLAQLVSPSADANQLAEVLRDPQIGHFDEVITLIDQPASTINQSVERFFKQKTSQDLLLLYFSGHGMLGDEGELYLAGSDTDSELLRSTAVPAEFFNQEMDRSLSQRQVLILDCCYSGSFARGAKAAEILGGQVGTASVFRGSGFGRVVLTASDTLQYAWDGEQVSGSNQNSVFTKYLIHGLRTGEADRDADGWIGLDELYDYVYENVHKETPKQTPSKWSYKQQGRIILARNSNPRAVALPTELRQALDSPYLTVREGAMEELGRMLQSGHTGSVLAARQALQKLVSDDSRSISSMASNLLEQAAGEAPSAAPAVMEPDIASPHPTSLSTDLSPAPAATKSSLEPPEANTVPPQPGSALYASSTTPAASISPIKPKKLVIMGALILISGLANIIFGLIFATSYFYPVAFMLFGIAEIVIGGLVLFAQPLSRFQREKQYTFLNVVAVVEISSILIFNIFSMILGIINLVLVRNEQVKRYFNPQ